MNVLLTGSLAVDQIMTFDGLFKDVIQPEKLDVLSISVLINHLKRTRGGIAGNIAYSLALLGEKPWLFASIGHEQKEYMSALAKLGVNIDHVHYSNLPTATFTVMTDKNNCQVGGFYPGAMADAKTLSFTQFKDKDVLVVLSAHDPDQMAIQIDECHSLKKRLFFDIGQQVIALPKAVLLKGLATAELLILNDYEMEVLATATGLTKDEVIRQVDTCVITLGENGCIVYQESQNWLGESVAPVKVTTVVDPTGAGDAFRAGFLYGYTRGWKASISAQLAATVAAFAIEQSGTQEHSFTVQELTDRYAQNYQHALEL